MLRLGLARSYLLFPTFEEEGNLCFRAGWEEEGNEDEEGEKQEEEGNSCFRAGREMENRRRSS